MPLYLPKELHDWYLRKRLELEIPMYDLFKSVLYAHAMSEGFIHEHRWKTKTIKVKYKGKLKTYDQFKEMNVCVICGEEEEIG